MVLVPLRHISFCAHTEHRSVFASFVMWTAIQYLHGCCNRVHFPKR